MPILDVEIVGVVPTTTRMGLPHRIAEAAALVFDSRPRGTWVKVRFIGTDAYAENGGDASSTGLPVIVSVLQAEPPSGDALAEQAQRLAAAVAEACDRPEENVHLVFEPPAAGRIAFGGRLRR